MGREDVHIWRPVGVAWQHKIGNGFDIVIDEQVSVSGRLVCTTPEQFETVKAEIANWQRAHDEREREKAAKPEAHAEAL